MANLYSGENGTPYFGDGVYYRLLQGRNGLITVITVQNFDEFDYNHSMYVKDSSGQSYMFDEESYAIEKLNEWYNQDEIDPEYRQGLNSFLTR